MLIQNGRIMCRIQKNKGMGVGNVGAEGDKYSS